MARYRVKYWDVQKQNWLPLCRRPDGTEVSAIPVAGRWDYRQGVLGGGSKLDDPSTFTFACEGSAITKCIHLGYKPWATVNGTSLAGHHQTCTRLIRADFCGDGTSYTVDGQWVNLYDGVGLQQDTEEWYLEAEWDGAGARCFSPHNRYHSHVPCYLERTQSACGQLSHFSTGTLLMSESPYRN